VEPLIGALRKRGALFRKAKYGGELEALDIFNEWETQGQTAVIEKK
jgi:hypothetical protein